LSASLQSIYSNLYCFLGFINHDLNKFAEAKSSLEKAIEVSYKNSEKPYEGIATLSLGRILGKKGQSETGRAEEHILKGRAMLEKERFKPFMVQGYFFLGELYANTGRKEDALKNLNKAMAMCHEMEIGFWPDKIQEVLDRL
jgi:tetratricopeptide (TPR) repeat protein